MLLFKVFGGDRESSKWSTFTEALVHTLMHHWAAAAMQVAAKLVGLAEDIFLHWQQCVMQYINGNSAFFIKYLVWILQHCCNS